MAGRGPDLDAYVTVAERIAAFYERYPEGSIQTEIIELTESRVVIRAFAYRSEEDRRPGIDHAAMAIPGATDYTRGSELENCSTSAVGRALAMLGFETNRGIASAEEVQSKADGDRAPAPAPRSGRMTFTGPLAEMIAATNHHPDAARDRGKRSAPAPAPAPAPAAPSPGSGRAGSLAVPGEMSVGDAMEIFRTYGIELKAVSAKGRELYGLWQLRAMTPAQRAHVVEELLADAGAALSAPPAPAEEATLFSED